MAATDIADRLARQIAFLVECDKLKEIFRQTVNTQSRRQENDAEHSWALCLFVITLAEHANEPVDVLRVLRMVLIHDIVEIDAGDSFIYDAALTATQHDREAEAADRLFGLLPADQAAEFRGLWDEFEAKATRESKFANAIDRFQPLLLNCLTGGKSWRQHGVTRNMVEDKNGRIAHGSQIIWDHAKNLLDRAMAEGILRS